jgi:predicted  nucleic acid-binding Zn-ribbon protein
MADNEDLNHRISSLEETMKEGMAELTDAVKTLIVLQTEHQATKNIVANHDVIISKLDERLDNVEGKMKEELPRVKRFLDRFDKITLTVTIAIVLAVTVTLLGLTYG